MVILDVAIVNVALPSIQGDLHFSDASLQWVISAYAIFFGGALLLGGRLADILGRRRLFVAGLAVFGISSLLCGIAWSEASLIVFRAVQGLGGALMAPAALSLLMAIFAEGRERNLALGFYGAVSGSGAAVGVLLGGVFTSYLTGRGSSSSTSRSPSPRSRSRPSLLPEGRSTCSHRHFDVAGAATATSGLMLLVYAMTRATTDGWGASLAGRVDRRLGRPDRGVHRHRAPIEGAAPAAADLPLAHAVGGERGDVDHRRRRVRGVLRAHALPAGRPALLARSRAARVHRLRRRRDRHLECRPVGRRPSRRSPDARPGPRALGSVGRPADAAAGRTACTSGTCSPPSCSAAPAWASRSSP